MKTFNLAKFLKLFLLTGVMIPLVFTACEEKEDPVEDPVASFQYAISETNDLEVTFTNYSQNAATYMWNFGDGETSTEENPIHEYAEYGNYTVTLTATNSADVPSTFEETFVLKDPNVALKLLTGETSKTWKLYREGVSMSNGPDATNPAGNWPGLSNDGARPCLYNQTFTFGLDGSFVFDDGGEFWGEFGVFDDTDFFEVCFPAEPANMVNKDGEDVSAWLSGTYTFEYETATGVLTLNGNGAWIGIPKLGPSGETTVPLQSTSCTIEITEETGYDLMTVAFDYGDSYWQIVYASYSDPSLEPEVVTEEAPFGEDLADITPTTMGVTFASHDPADLDVLDTIASGSTVDFGVDDPADATAAKVGQFNRTGAQYQELQFRTIPTDDPKDILFDNLTTCTFEVYFPSSNDYTGDLTKGVVAGFGDISETKDGWWNDLLQPLEDDGSTVTLDTWITYTVDLTDAKTRTDLDMFYIGIGGSNHTATGTFYVRDLKFE